MALTLTNRPRVAIYLSNAYQTNRELLEGILQFIKLRSPWVINVELGRAGESSHTDLKCWGCTGIITNRRDPRLIAFARQSGVPSIVTEMQRPFPGNVIGSITSGDASIGRTAARHLASLGFENFAFIGEASGRYWSLKRGHSFRQQLREFGKRCHFYLKAPDSVRDNDAQEHRFLQDWIRRLPKPVGIFAACDLRARQILDICLDAGVQVPHDAGILGVDNDTIICETASIPLSSITLSTHEAGFRAAMLLDDAMAGRHISKSRQEIVYADTEVIQRASTDRRIVNDPLASHCLELITSNPDGHFAIGDLVKRLCVSRRTLENHVKAATGHTIANIIADFRLERAKTLLKETSLSLERIAESCGFCDASHLSNTIRRRCGKPASSFRRGLGSKIHDDDPERPPTEVPPIRI